MAESDGINKESIATTSEMAGIMGLTPRRLQQLVADGVLDQVETGRFQIGETVQRYITFIKGNGKSEEEKKLDLEMKKAEVKVKKARARREELKTAELDGKMYRVEDVSEWCMDLVYAVKGAVMALPPRVAVDVAAEDNPAVCGEIVKREVKMILRDLANYEYDPEFYRERLAERQKMELKFMQDKPADDDDE